MDARTGAVLCALQRGQAGGRRRQRPGTFSGSTGDGANGCGKPHPISVSGAHSIGVFATATLPANDIVLKLIGPSGSAVASSDTATSPEEILYSDPADGTYQIVVCASTEPTVSGRDSGAGTP